MLQTKANDHNHSMLTMSKKLNKSEARNIALTRFVKETTRNQIHLKNGQSITVYDAIMNKLSPEDKTRVRKTMDLEGNKIEGDLKPSSDTPTHLELYKKYPDIGGIVHTHSPEATSWAQAGRDIPLYGTTHADYFFGPIPCARSLTPEEIDEAYETNTGKVIIETFETRGINPVYTPGVLCTNHGPFTWGKDAAEAVHNAVVLEEVAKMATRTELINPKVQPAPDCIRDKHFFRKHGANAYYGQQ